MSGGSILKGHSDTHFGKVCSRLDNSRFVFCKKILRKVRKKSSKHDLPKKNVPECPFEIYITHSKAQDKLQAIKGLCNM